MIVAGDGYVEEVDSYGGRDVGQLDDSWGAKFGIGGGTWVFYGAKF